MTITAPTVKVIARAADGFAHVRLVSGGEVLLDYTIQPCSYAGTTDNRLDRWYVTYQRSGLLRGLVGDGYVYKRDAIEAARLMALTEASGIDEAAAEARDMEYEHDALEAAGAAEMAEIRRLAENDL